MSTSEPEQNNSKNKDKDGKTIKYCKICEDDRATGKYYGVHVCDGCKGFFRRSLRSNQVYYCRFQRNCVIRKDNRNQCRYCRLRKCFRVGMKKSTLQSERERRSKAKREKQNLDTDVSIIKISNTVLTSTLTLECLVHAHSSLYSRKPPTENEKTTANDFYDSAKEQILLLSAWAKLIPAFCELSVEDKVALLRGSAGHNLVLVMVHRSMHLENALLLGNGFVITRESQGIVCEHTRVMDELVKPLRLLKVDDTEFSCLKAVIFFDPNAPGLSEPERIHALRHQAQLLLENYMLMRDVEPKGRFGEILLILRPLGSIVERIREEMQFRKLFGMARIDKLLRETLLRDEMDELDIPLPEEMISPIKLATEAAAAALASPAAQAHALVSAPRILTNQEQIDLARPSREQIRESIIQHSKIVGGQQRFTPVPPNECIRLLN